ncbi:unnamed protein product, partial [Iphiclides podalirius]
MMRRFEVYVWLRYGPLSRASFGIRRTACVHRRRRGRSRRPRLITMLGRSTVSQARPGRFTPRRDNYLACVSPRLAFPERRRRRQLCRR